MAELRDYQTDSIAKIRQAIASNKRPILQSPTGSGKGLIAAEIIKRARAKGKKVAYVVPLLSLINQAWRVFTDAGVDERDIGIMQGHHVLTNAAAPCQIASAQTLCRREFPDADVIIYDEVHIWHKSHEQWITDRPDACFVGLSASPGRAGLGKWFDELIVATTIGELQDKGYLCRYRAFGPSSPDLSGVKTTAGDFNEADLSNAVDKPKLVADIVETWIGKANRRPTFVFAVDVAHAKHLVDAFKERGVYATYITADTELEDRDEILRQLKVGLFEVVVSVATIGTGVDAPFVSCAVLARPTKSKMMHIQQIGRVLRPKEDGSEALILDHADNLMRLGFPEDISFSLSKSEKEKSEKEPKEKLPKLCPDCKCVMKAGVSICENCGFVRKDRESGIQVIDGELSEIHAGKRGEKIKVAVTHEMKQRWYSGFLYIGDERGYSRGWAANQYRSKFGVWPRGLIDEPHWPTAEVRGWVKSRQIAYAKAKDKIRKAS